MNCYSVDEAHRNFMAFSTRSYARPYIGVPGLPRGIKWLLIANVAMFLLQWLLRGTALAPLFFNLALIPSSVVHRFYIWQLGTYSFVHVDMWEVLWNMLTLWMFGSDIEQTWGTDRFLQFYLICGTGAAVFVVLLNYIFGNPAIPTIGASAPIYGILLVCAVLWPERQVLFIIFPMKMKYFTILVGAIALYLSLNSANGASTIGLLTGMIFAYGFLKTPRMKRVDLFGSLDQSYKAWKLARAKKKFQVYLNKKNGPGRGPWVN
jgi:membrane associated rhomboid family serine protease